MKTPQIPAPWSQHGQQPAQPAPARKLETVIIPGSVEHNGMHAIRVTLLWKCPTCGAERGKPEQTRSYDGSRILYCDGWTNPCGHVDLYEDVREEARTNGMNKDTFEGYDPVT